MPYNIDACATLPLFQLARNTVGESRGAENVPKNLVHSFFLRHGDRVSIPDAGGLVLDGLRAPQIIKHGESHAFLVLEVVVLKSFSLGRVRLSAK